MMLKKIIAFLLLISAVVSLSGCSFILNLKSLEGDGNVLPRNYELAAEAYSIDIDNINLESFSILLNVDELLEDKLTITTDDNIFSSLKISVDDVNHVINIEGDETRKYLPSEFEITVGCPVRNINADGAYTVSLNLSSVKEAELEFNGAVSGSILCDSVRRLELDVDGAAELEFSGRAVEFIAEVNGASEINAFGLECEIARVFFDGASKAKLNVTGEIYASVDGSAVVEYKGNAEVKQKQIRGLGEINRVEG